MRSRGEGEVEAGKVADAGAVEWVAVPPGIEANEPASTAAPAAGSFMYPGQQLLSGHSARSSTMTLTMQSDGNLAARLNTGKGAGQVVWSTGTSGNLGACTVMQTDGNLVVHKHSGGPGKGGAPWATGTNTTAR
ncbi:hypothetical protein AB0D11_38525 [Streptomyces monashensis]|uniref:hypothetical protein n=1 Tax=Streptomyces monashensis TaxID=1678012 RepID=UPI0033ED2809